MDYHSNQRRCQENPYDQAKNLLPKIIETKSFDRANCQTVLLDAIIYKQRETKIGV